MSKHNSPVNDKAKVNELREERIKAFKENPFLLQSGFDVASLKNNDELLI